MVREEFLNPLGPTHLETERELGMSVSWPMPGAQAIVSPMTNASDRGRPVAVVLGG